MQELLEQLLTSAMVSSALHVGITLQDRTQQWFGNWLGLCFLAQLVSAQLRWEARLAQQTVFVLYKIDCWHADSDV